MSRPLRHGMGGARGSGQGVPGGCCVGVSALTSNGLQIYLRRCKVLCLVPRFSVRACVISDGVGVRPQWYTQLHVCVCVCVCVLACVCRFV